MPCEEKERSFVVTTRNSSRAANSKYGLRNVRCRACMGRRGYDITSCLMTPLPALIDALRVSQEHKQLETAYANEALRAQPDYHGPPIPIAPFSPALNRKPCKASSQANPRPAELSFRGALAAISPSSTGLPSRTGWAFKARLLS